MVRFGFVSTYPPTLCGLATFTSALRAELVAPGHGSVIRLVDTPQPALSPDVAAQLVAGDPAGARMASAKLASSDVVILQHEYGVYGGEDGDEILGLLREISAPTIVVLHTVLSAPTVNQKRILEAVAAMATAVVTMTPTAKDRLADSYIVDMGKVTVIPHGAPASHRAPVASFRTGAPTVLSWGLIGPGKGVEWGIAAMALLTDLQPAPRYVIAGQTHPKVLAYEGDVYRERLQRQIVDLGLEDTVTLDGRYRSASELEALVDSADVVLLPYDSTDQVTSGVLIEAVAALKPVVATRFPHSVELLGAGAGLLVPQQDAQAIADALRTLLTHRELSLGMTRAAAATAPELLWPAVAGRYRELAEQLLRARLAA